MGSNPSGGIDVKQMDTLVLSSGYEPQMIVDWQRAVTLWAEDKVEILESYPDRMLRSASITMQMPAVVVFKYQTRPRRRVVRFSRDAIYQRDDGRCAYCQVAVRKEEITYDHVRPRTQGGATTWDNIVISCGPCNTRKGGRTPQEAGMKLHVKPHKPKSLPTTTPCGLWHAGMPELWAPYMQQRQAG